MLLFKMLVHILIKSFSYRHGQKHTMILFIKMDTHYFILHGGLHGHLLYHYLLQEYPMDEPLKSLL